jgi:hypothetical protein
VNVDHLAPVGRVAHATVVCVAQKQRCIHSTLVVVIITHYNYGAAIVFVFIFTLVIHNATAIMVRCQ